ncbi:MAG: hypothetical protein JWP63_6659 [Candidatus Solibacter sp.]|jgi:hypothetical protein|nr:hypothetical protein [Candidatus Solibacter sp.]
MAETGTPTNNAPELEAKGAPAGGRSKDDIALELMKFIAVTTGFGKSGGSSAGFSGKPTKNAAEEHVDELLGLFERCRKTVGKE